MTGRYNVNFTEYEIGMLRFALKSYSRDWRIKAYDSYDQKDELGYRTNLGISNDAEKLELKLINVMNSIEAERECEDE